MKLIVGLGNPGKKYDNTRHNIGFSLIDKLVSDKSLAYKKKKSFLYTVAGDKAVMLKPLTYMNLSGTAVEEAVNCFSISDIMVVFDDIYIPFGTVRIRKTGSDGGHKGIRSVQQSISPLDFTRLKIGIGEPNQIPEDISGSCPDDTRPLRLLSAARSCNKQTASYLVLSDYVLSKFKPQENQLLEKTLSFSAALVNAFIDYGYEEMINYYSKNKNILPC